LQNTKNEYFKSKKSNNIIFGLKDVLNEIK